MAVAERHAPPRQCIAMSANRELFYHGGSRVWGVCGGQLYILYKLPLVSGEPAGAHLPDGLRRNHSGACVPLRVCAQHRSPGQNAIPDDYFQESAHVRHVMALHRVLRHFHRSFPSLPHFLPSSLPPRTPGPLSHSLVCLGNWPGFSSSFPKLIQDIFGYIKCPADAGDGTGICPNPNAPQADIYAFLGPLLGALIRPFGGWLSDKFGGAVVTQVYIGIMTADAIGIGLVVHRANSADRPEEYFSLFLCLFLVLFTTSGTSSFLLHPFVPQLHTASVTMPRRFFCTPPLPKNSTQPPQAGAGYHNDMRAHTHTAAWAAHVTLVCGCAWQGCPTGLPSSKSRKCFVRRVSVSLWVPCWDGRRP